MCGTVAGARAAAGPAALPGPSASRNTARRRQQWRWCWQRCSSPDAAAAAMATTVASRPYGGGQRHSLGPPAAPRLSDAHLRSCGRGSWGRQRRASDGATAGSPQHVTQSRTRSVLWMPDATGGPLAPHTLPPAPRFKHSPPAYRLSHFGIQARTASQTRWRARPCRWTPSRWTREWRAPGLVVATSVGDAMPLVHIIGPSDRRGFSHI